MFLFTMTWPILSAIRCGAGRQAHGKSPIQIMAGVALNPVLDTVSARYSVLRDARLVGVLYTAVVSHRHRKILDRLLTHQPADHLWTQVFGRGNGKHP